MLLFIWFLHTDYTVLEFSLQSVEHGASQRRRPQIGRLQAPMPRPQSQAKPQPQFQAKPTHMYPTATWTP